LRNTEYGMYLPKELNGTYRLSAVTELYIRPKDILFRLIVCPLSGSCTDRKRIFAQIISYSANYF
jgi:hypothetical protein